MSIFTIEPYESLTQRPRRTDTIKLEIDFSVPGGLKSYQDVFKYVEKECDRKFHLATKELSNVVQKSIELDCVADYSYSVEAFIGIEFDETRDQYYRRRQAEINKLKKQMDKEEVRKIEEADRLKAEYEKYLSLQEKFKDFDPSVLS